MSRSAHGAGARRPRLVVWHEALIGYLAPAAVAGTAGVATGQPGLVAAAFTTIAGTSAGTAAALAAWLRTRDAPPDGPATAAGGRRRRLPRPVAATSAGALAAGAGCLLAVGVVGLMHLPPRLLVDLPLSAGIAATVVTWRWLRRLRTGG